MSAEKMLLRRLLQNYDRIGRSGRPVLNVNTTVHVYFALGLIQMDLNEKDNILSISVWTRYQWIDEYLRWDPSKYDGVQSIRLEPSKIWIPDIILYNTADPITEQSEALAVASHQGEVTWYPHTIFRGSCSVDVTNYPFDHQHCQLWFGSWTHTSSEVNLLMGFPEGIDLSTFESDYNESCAWNIINVTANRTIRPSPNENPNYVVFTFDLFLQRKVVFSSYILTLPCIFFAFLTLVVFWLPPDRPDRTGLAMSTFSSFMFLLLILVETAPSSAKTVPILGVYYCYNMVIIMLSIILSSLVVNISRGDTKKMPKWLSYCLKKISFSDGSTLTCCHGCNSKKKKDNNRGSNSDSEATNMINTSPSSSDLTYLSKSQRFDVAFGLDIYGRPKTRDSEDYSSGDNGFRLNKNNHTRFEQQLLDIKASVHRMEQMTRETLKREKTVREIRAEWCHLALTLDRIFFVIYLGLIILSLFFLFPKPW